MLSDKTTGDRVQQIYIDWKFIFLNIHLPLLTNMIGVYLHHSGLKKNCISKVGGNIGKYVNTIICFVFNYL